MRAGAWQATILGALVVLTSCTQTDVPAAAAASYPNLGPVPPKPVISTVEERRRLLDQLTADRAGGQALAAGQQRR